MTRIIYSLYIDIPEDELDYQPPHYGKNISKTLETKIELKKYYDWLKEMHIRYSEACSIEYKLFEYDSDFVEYKKWFSDRYHQITAYNVVNFYKLHLLYELGKSYDEILYLDFDAVPVTHNNFFDHWDLTKGVAILSNRKAVDDSLQRIFKDSRKAEIQYRHSIRSPTAKYWNCRAMLLESGMSGLNDVYNTGIIGINKDHLHQLNYWDNFDDLLDQMTELREDEYSMYPPHIQRLFGYDNETIWSYRMKMNSVPSQLLTPEWHHFMDKWDYVPQQTNIVHVINKNFQYVKDWYEKNNL